MTASTIKKPGVEREHIAAQCKPGTKAFLETYRQEHGLRSWSDALRLLINNAREERELKGA